MAAKTIINKFAGNCAETECGTRVPAGAGIARKATSGKWEVRCDAHKGETNGATNPWRDLHRTAEMDYCGGEYTRARGKALVDSEYEGTDSMAEKCDTCGGTCWWRATVGARMCDNCGTMIVYKWIKGTLDFERKLITR